MDQYSNAATPSIWQNDSSWHSFLSSRPTSVALGSHSSHGSLQMNSGGHNSHAGGDDMNASIQQVCEFISLNIHSGTSQKIMKWQRLFLLLSNVSVSLKHVIFYLFLAFSCCNTIPTGTWHSSSSLTMLSETINCVIPGCTLWCTPAPLQTCRPVRSSVIRTHFRTFCAVQQH